MSEEELHYQDSIKFDYLLEACQKCIKGEFWKASVANYYINRVQRILRLTNECQNKTFKLKAGRTFKVYSPKERTIRSDCFENRIYERSFNDNVLFPKMSKSYILDNTACQKGKGNFFALERLKKFLWNYYCNYSISGFLLQIDIHKYYPTMNHRYVENLYRSKLNDDDLKTTLEILKNQSTEQIGFDAGNQTIQITGISNLDYLDHFIKEKLRIKYYIRHMDDMILLHENKSYLKYCKNKIEEEIAKKEFTFNPTKTHIAPIINPFCFLGYKFKLSNTGKIYISVKKETIRRQEKHLKNLFEKRIPFEQIEQSYQSMLSHLQYGNSFKAVQYFKRYYRNLIKEFKHEQN